MTYNFDKFPNRNNTNCYKHDALNKFFDADDITPLWVADADFEAPDFITDAIIRRANNQVYGYTFFSDSFFESAINWMQKRHGFAIEKEWISITPGVVTGIAMAIMSLTSADDEIVIQSPVYPPFYQLVKSNNRKLILNNLKIEDGCYKMDFEDLKQKITSKTKMIIVSNPHNPIGRVWTKAELLELVQICEKNNILIIADEIHCDIVFSPSKYTPIASINEYSKNNTITFIAPSKTFNIAGLNTSMCIIQNTILKAKYSALLEQLHIENGNVFGTVAMEAAYTYGAEWLDQMLDYLQKTYEEVKQMFVANNSKITVYPLEGTYLMWIDFSGLNILDHELNTILLTKAKVALNNGIDFGENRKLFRRLNIASPRSIVTDAVERIIREL